MNDLDKELIQIIGDGQPTALAVADIVNDVKQAFVEAGWQHTDFKDKADELLQDMTNMHVNMKHDLLRLGLIENLPILRDSEDTK